MRHGKLPILAPLVLVILIAGCGSSSKTASANAQVAKDTCRQVEAVLSDGPEPETDPVGYAQAQVLPLRQIDTSDGQLRQALDRLASAYQTFSSSHGASSAKSAVSVASKAIDDICPGAAS